MDQSSYLSQTLWDYRERGLYTDLTLVCEDGSLPTHSAMLAGLFASFRINFISREEVPECLFLPGLATATVKEAIGDLYFKCDTNLIMAILKPIVFVKAEVEEKDSKSYKPENYDGLDEVDDNQETDELEKDNFLPDNKYEKIEQINKQETLMQEPKDEVSDTELDCKTNTDIKSLNRKVGRPKSSFSAKYSSAFECTKCGELCIKKVTLVKHMVQAHGYQTKQEQNKIIENPMSCQYCERILKTNITMNDHLATIHREHVLLNHPEIKMSTPCQECDLMFYGIRDLDKHSRNVHNKSLRKFTCPICQDTFESATLQLKHRKQIHKDESGVSKCPYCEKTIKHFGIKKHIFNTHRDKRSLHPEIPVRYRCDDCDEEFHDEATRNNHKDMIHTTGGKCHICSKVYTKIQSFKSHMKTHSNEVHVCEICSKEFKGKHLLKDHLKRHDGSINQDYKFPCLQCNKKYQSEKCLQQHMVTAHSGVQYICSQCPKSFRTTQLRQCHEKKIHAEKTFKCQECDQMFSGQGYLNGHIRKIHVKAKDKICPHCGEAFSSTNITSFNAHVKRHTNDRQYSCETCGKDFLIPSHLKQHMKRHTLPFHCDLCDERKGSMFDMEAHKRQVHGGVQLTCRFKCGWQTWQSGNRNRHERTCQLNPMPNAPYTIAIGTATNYTLETFQAKIKR